MTHRWVYDPATGEGSQEFDSQQSAEDWLGSEWRELLDSGVLKVTLFEGDQRVYEMKLTAD